MSLLGGAADIVLDETRGRLYLVSSTSNNISVYSIAQQRFLNPIRVDALPAAAVMSRNGKFLYVTCTSASNLNVIDLDTTTVTQRVTLPAQPEGVAVGFDNRVVITTVGTGQGQATLLIYDPGASSDKALLNVVIAPAAPTPPQLPAPSGQLFKSVHSQMLTTRDGRYIVGVNGSGNNRIIFVHDVLSGTVLRSRIITNISSVLSVAPDGSKFMAGSTLFDFETLSVLAQLNASNAPFSFPGGNSSNFNLQQNQGGSVFSPDGASLWSGFNIAPVQNPPARTNVSRLLQSDPDNLLIQTGYQLPENLAGKMVITADGSRIYALSESGFMILPIGNIRQSPIAMPDQSAVLLTNDQCGVTAKTKTATMNIRNMGGGARMTATTQLLQLPVTGPAGLGGAGGPGGGGTGGTIVIILPPTVPGGGNAGVPVAPGGVGGNAGTAIAQTSPMLQIGPGGTQVTFNFNPAAARAPGTITPHDFLIQSPEAINIPPNVRVYQNNRDAEARGTVVPVAVNASASEGLVDMLTDNARQRIYIANSGMNRIEVFDMRRQVFLAPIKVGQFPRSMAFGMDNVSLYVANTGGESISIVDLDQMKVTGTVKFPPLPFNAAFALVSPSQIASTQRGPQIVMSDGTLWKVVGNEALPRTLNPAVFGTNVRVVNGGNPAVRTLTSSPEGRFVMLFAGTGFVYIYSSDADDYVAGRQVLSPPLTGYIGPIAAGPNGRYYIVNSTILNDALTPVASGAGTVVGPAPGGGLPDRGGAVAATSRPISAVAAVGNTNFARFTTPIRANNNTQPADAGTIEVVDVNTGQLMASAPSLETPLAAVAGNGRAAVPARTMAVDASGTSAYVLTTSGLTIVPLTRSARNDAPAVNRNGIVSTASYLPSVAPGGLISIFGANLASSASSPSAPLPALLGGSCVTLNNSPLPLIMTSAGQINAQLPPTLTAGRYNVVIRSADRQVGSATTQLTVSKYAPAVFVWDGGVPAILHKDGTPVTKDHPAKRDEQLVIYATGLGATKGGKVTAGQPAPSDPLAVTEKIQVFFGNPGYKEAEMIVDWSGLAPGMIGLNQINIRVPGAHIKGNALPVQLRIGGVNSPSTGPAIPTVAVE